MKPMRSALLRALAATASLALASCHAASPRPWPVAEWSSLPARDGARAGLYRYALLGRPAERAVLLLPEVGGTESIFDRGGRGLAPYLASRGLEVFALEYRGTGRSGEAARGYALEDLLDFDAEAALARALDGRTEVAVVGCGLGGTLGLALAARHPKQVPAVAALQAPAALGSVSEPLAQLLAGAESLPEWSISRAFRRRRSARGPGST